MSEYMWGVSYQRPSRAKARKMDRICQEEGGYGLNEVNVHEGRTLGVNNGKYQGWFCGPNRGCPFDDQLAARVSERVRKECR